MFMPNLLRNFLYTLPWTGYPMLDLIMWLVSREIHCAATFCRNFFWTGEWHCFLQGASNGPHMQGDNALCYTICLRYTRAVAACM